MSRIIEAVHISTGDPADNQHLMLAAAFVVPSSPTAVNLQLVVATRTQGALLIAPDKKHLFAGSLPSDNLI